MIKAKCARCGHIWVPRKENDILTCRKCQKPQIAEKILFEEDDKDKG